VRLQPIRNAEAGEDWPKKSICDVKTDEQPRQRWAPFGDFVRGDSAVPPPPGAGPDLAYHSIGTPQWRLNDVRPKRTSSGPPDRRSKMEARVRDRRKR